jgi:hypothetical protein
MGLLAHPSVWIFHLSNETREQSRPSEAENLIVAQLLNKLPVCYEIRRFIITVFRRLSQWIISVFNIPVYFSKIHFSRFC